MLHVAGRPMVEYRHAPIEFAEVASMTMELFGDDYLNEFYSDEDAARAKRKHVEGIIGLLPWIARVDAFQHWIYTHPGHSGDERTATWRALGERFDADTITPLMDRLGEELSTLPV